jgi:hypothetical protein
VRQDSLSAYAEAVVFVALALSAAIHYWPTIMPLMLHRREFGTDQFSVCDGELYVGRIYKTRKGNWYWGLDPFAAGSVYGHTERQTRL